MLERIAAWVEHMANSVSDSFISDEITTCGSKKNNNNKLKRLLLVTVVYYINVQINIFFNITD